jgi:hypothetical protein
MNDDEEVWKPVPDFPEILASDLGRVKRVAFRSREGKLRKERLLRPQRGYGAALRKLSGYIRVTRGQNVHDLCLADVICAAFFPEFDAEFHQASFLDGNPANCAVRNIILIPRFAAKLAKRLGGEPTNNKNGESA